MEKKTTVEEEEEYQEVQRLLELSKLAQAEGKPSIALQHLDTALEINDAYLPTLQHKVSLLVEKGSFAAADSVADIILKLDDQDPMGYYIKADVSLHLRRYKESAVNCLHSLERDYNDPDSATILLSKACSRLIGVAPKEFSDDIASLSVYARLSELGLAFLSASHHLLAIHTLQTAARYETNQLGVTTRAYTTLGHAYGALGHSEEAASAYGHARDVAAVSRDVRGQTIALVGTAGVRAESGDSYRAILAYEQLMELKGCMDEDGTTDEIWTDVFLGKLYMNMCAAYQRIGYADHSIRYAHKYFSLYPPQTVSPQKDEPGAASNNDVDSTPLASVVTTASMKIDLPNKNAKQATSVDAEVDEKMKINHNIDAANLHRHLGSLYAIVNREEESLRAFRMSLGCATLAHSVSDMALAHGHIGATLCRMARDESSFTDGLKSHEKDISICEEAGDRRGIAVAAEILGDTYSSSGKHEQAEEAYNKMLAAEERHTLLSATALYKIGGTHLARGQKMRAAYYYDAAEKAVGTRGSERVKLSKLSLSNNEKSGRRNRVRAKNVTMKGGKESDEHPYARALIEIRYGLACSLQSSGEFSDLERARKYFEELIGQLEEQINLFVHETAYFPSSLVDKLSVCYEGAIDIHFRTSGVTDALVLAENMRVFLRNLLLRKIPLPARLDLDGSRQPISHHREEAVVDASQLREKLRSRAKPRTPGRVITARGESRPAGGLGTAKKASGIEDILNIVNRQQATVVYFGATDDGLYVWVLQPCDGLVKSYSRKANRGESGGMKSELQQLIAELHAPFTDGGNGRMWYISEKRNIPSALAGPSAGGRSAVSSTPTASHKVEGKGDIGSDDTSNSSDSSYDFFKSLYTQMFGPTDDILKSLPPGSPLVIIPNAALALFPFHHLRDWRGEPLSAVYRLTILPNLSALSDCTGAALRDFARNDFFERAGLNIRFGGLQAMNGCHAGFGGGGAKDILILGKAKNTNLEYARSSAHISNPKLRSALKPEENSSKVNTCSSAVEIYQQLDNTSGPDSALSPPKQSTEGAGTFYTQIPIDRKQENLKSDHTRSKGGVAKVGKRRGKTQVNSALTVASNYRRFGSLPEGRSGLHVSHPVGAARKTRDLLRLRNCTTLTSCTSTGTDILTSSTSVPEFQQLSHQECCVVIGNPEITESVLVNGTQWKPNDNRDSCQKELDCVTNVLKCDAIFGRGATKEKFLDAIPSAAIIHIATFIDLQSGVLCFGSARKQSALSTKPFFLSGTSACSQQHVLTRSEISMLTLQAKLVVISGGWARQNIVEPVEATRLLSLAAAFVRAGVQSVLLIPCPLPGDVLNTFYHTLYSACHYGSSITAAVSKAAHAAKEQFKHHDYLRSAVFFPHLLVGTDAYVNLFDIKKAMLNQEMDDVEAIVSGEMDKPPLNLKPPRTVDSLCEKLEKLQLHLVPILLLPRSSIDDIILELSDLVSGTIRLHQTTGLSMSAGNGATSIKHRPRLLSRVVVQSIPAIRLLKFLAFHFQLSGSSVENTSPAVVFPHWDPDGLLSRANHALHALLVLSKYPETLEPLHDAFPLSQRVISYLTDLLAMTKHSAAIQLQITDTGVIPVWTEPSTRTALLALGFQQIGSYLQFTRSETSIEILTASLRLLVSLSQNKTISLVHKMDISQLSSEYEHKPESPHVVQSSLPSHLPTILPDERISMKVPWSSRMESREEMTNKLHLASRHNETRSEYQEKHRHARRSTQNVILPLADQSVSQIGVPVNPAPGKLKVTSGATPSHDRVPVGVKPTLDANTREQRRRHSHDILKVRQENVKEREIDAYKGQLIQYSDKVY